MPRFSVIIPAYNHAHFVREAVESVLAQTEQDLELLVVDDGSTDDTARVLLPYRKYPHFHYIKRKNGGLPAARNTGITHASGEFIAFLDADDIWLPTKLETQSRLFAEHPDAGLVSSDASFFSGRGTLAKTFFDRTPPHAGMCFLDLLRANFVPMPTVMIKREVLERVGVFNESLKSSEDYEMWLRIPFLFPLFFTPEIGARYRLHAQNMTKNVVRMAETKHIVLNSFLQPPYSEQIPLDVQVDIRSHISFALVSAYLRSHEFEKSRAPLHEIRQLIASHPSRFGLAHRFRLHLFSLLFRLKSRAAATSFFTLSDLFSHLDHS